MSEGKKIWGLALLGAGVYYLLNDGLNLNKKIVDIAISMKRTFKNEGTWYPEPKGGSRDTGDYYKGAFYGTNWGVTAAFIAEYFPKMRLTHSTIKDLTQLEAFAMYEQTEGRKMRYSEMTNQAVADFIFDWMIQRPATCVRYMTEDIFDLPEGSATTKGVYSNLMMRKINGSNPAELYNSLKFWRLYHLTYTETYKSFRKGVYNRIVSFKDYPDSAAVMDMMAKAKAKAFGN